MGGRICSTTAGPIILYMRVGLEGRNLVITTRQHSQHVFDPGSGSQYGTPIYLSHRYKGNPRYILVSDLARKCSTLYLPTSQLRLPLTPPKEDTSYSAFYQGSYYQNKGGLPIYHCLLGSRIPGQMLLINIYFSFLQQQDCGKGRYVQGVCLDQQLGSHP